MKHFLISCPLLALFNRAFSLRSPVSEHSIPIVPSEKNYIIIDNDWTSSSYILPLLALDAGWQVLGLVSGTGNTWQHQGALHAIQGLAIGNLSSCVPVVEGATWPLINTPSRLASWESVHGKLPYRGAFTPYNATAEALGHDPTSGDPYRINKLSFIEGFPSDHLIESLKHVPEISAAAFMIEQVHKFPGQVTILGAGAMTNIALAVRLDSQFASLAKKLVIQGGIVDTNLIQTTGSTLLADINNDFNLSIDPEASKIVLLADWPDIIFVGNVANQVLAKQEFLDEVYQIKNPYSELMYNHYGAIFPFWDETATAIAVDPGLNINSTTLYIDINTSYSSPSYGHIHVYQQAFAPPGTRNATYIHTTDANKVLAIIKRAVQFPKDCRSIAKN